MSYRKELLLKRNGFHNEGPKPPKPIKPISDKKAAALKIAKEEGETKKEKWFKERRKEMTGHCLFCGGKTEKNNDTTFRNSIAHLLPKKESIGGLPSVAYHPDNWIELCYYGNSCHANFDTGQITWEFLRNSMAWRTILSKYRKIEPFISPEELKYVPSVLRNVLTNQSS